MSTTSSSSGRRRRSRRGRRWSREGGMVASIIIRGSLLCDHVYVSVEIDRVSDYTGRQ